MSQFRYNLAQGLRGNGANFLKLNISNPHISAIFLLLLLLVVISLPIFHPTNLSGDIEMVMHPAKVFSKTGRLENTDQLTPAQLLRFNNSVITNSFGLNYLGPVFLFALAIKIFGATDFTFFLVQSLFWLILFLLTVRLFKDLAVATIVFFILVFFDSFDGGTYASPTQLPVICLYVALWGDWNFSRSYKSLLLLGSILGLGLSFRPETLFLILIYVANLLLNKSRNKSWLALVFSAAVVYLALEKIRLWLGGCSSADHTFYNVGTDIFAPGWFVVNVEKTTPLNQLFTDPILRKKLTAKLIHAFNRTFAIDTFLFFRKDFFFLGYVVFALTFRSGKTKKYLELISLFSFQFILNSFLNDVPRYYDYVFVLMGLQMFQDFGSELRSAVNSNANLKYFPIALILLIILAAQSARGIYKQRNYYSLTEKDYRSKMERIVKSFSNTDIILSNNGPDLLWYGNAKLVIVAPQYATTMSKVINRFPQSMVVYFTQVPNGIYEGLIPLEKYNRRQLSDDIVLLSPQ